MMSEENEVRTRIDHPYNSTGKDRVYQYLITVYFESQHFKVKCPE